MSRVKKFASLAAVAVAVPLALATSAGPAGAVVGPGHLWNDSNSVNQCVAASGNHHNAQVIMWNCDAEAGQSWQNYMHYDATAGQIKNGNGDCLDETSQSEGSNIYAMTCMTGGDLTEQLWDFVSVRGTTYVELVNRSSGMCLSVAGGSTANGSRVIAWKCQGTLDQLWGGPAID